MRPLSSILDESRSKRVEKHVADSVEQVQLVHRHGGKSPLPKKALPLFSFVDSAGVVAVSGEITLWSVYLAIGVMFWVAGFDLLYSLQDMAFDKANGLHSIPSKFGAQKTMWIARCFHLLAVFFWILFVQSANLGIWAQIAVLFSAIMLSYEHYIVNKDFTKIDKAFFTVNGYLGFVFLILILMEVL